MSKVTLDEVLRSKLNGLNETVEVCDESGRTVGHFLPEDVYKQLLYAWAKVEFAQEEAEEGRHRYDGTNGMTTARAIAYLEGLPDDGGA